MPSSSSLVTSTCRSNSAWATLTSASACNVSSTTKHRHVTVLVARWRQKSISFLITKSYKYFHWVPSNDKFYYLVCKQACLSGLLQGCRVSSTADRAIFLYFSSYFFHCLLFSPFLSIPSSFLCPYSLTPCISLYHFPSFPFLSLLCLCSSLPQPTHVDWSGQHLDETPEIETESGALLCINIAITRNENN